MLPKPEQYLDWKQWGSKLMDVLNWADRQSKKELKFALGSVGAPLVFTGVTLAPVNQDWEYDEKIGRFSANFFIIAPGAPVTMSITGLQLGNKSRLQTVAGHCITNSPAAQMRKCIYQVASQRIDISLLAGDASFSVLLML